MESGCTQLTSGDLVCNYIYTSPGRTKSSLYADLCKRQTSIIVSVRKVEITNIDVRVWTRKHDFPQRNQLPTFANKTCNYKTYNFQNYGY